MICTHYRIKLSLIFLLFFYVKKASAQEPSSIIFEDAQGCLRYVMDENDNRIVDFSFAGYKKSEEEIPTVSVVATISPITGDNTSAIQSVIDSVSNLTPDANGIRGAILLEAGTYEIHGTLQMTTSGVVLRGVGDGDDENNNTILTGVGNTPAGSWLASINGGGTSTDAPWAPNEIDIFFKRTVTNVNLENGKVTLDVPIYDHLDKSLATAQIYKLAETDIKTNIGIENLRIEILTNGELSEDHARNAIELRGVEDCWVSDVTGLHFTYAMVDMNVASRVTVQNCKALEPHSLIDGGKRYNFAVGRKSNNILFTNCEASEGRHSFVSNGSSSVSGIVWHNCVSTGDYSTTEGHRRWSQALLFDNITFLNPNTTRLVGLYSRGSFGTGHGWSAANSVAWNIKMPSSSSVVIQRPPRRQNYGIACQGTVTGQGPFAQPQGYIEDSGSEPLITSLFEKQLSHRLENGSPVDAPARFLVERINDDIEVTWLDIADNESEYIIEISYDGSSFQDLAEVAANETSYTFPSSQLTSEMFYLRMYANSETLCPSAYTYTFFTNLSVNIEEPKNSYLKIFPNPVVDILEIEVENTSISDIKLYGLEGKIIPFNFSNNKLNLTSLSAGIYFIKVETNDGNVLIKKFVKA